jgi:hypothetical protein
VREQLVDEAALPAQQVLDARDVQPGRLRQPVPLVPERVKPSAPTSGTSSVMDGGTRSSRARTASSTASFAMTR